MIYRLWLVASVLWAAVMFSGSSPSAWGQKDADVVLQLLVLIFLPFIAGFMLKRMARYVFTGRMT